MQLSIVIPCFNVTSVIGDQLNALAEQKWEHTWEVIIADNGSNNNLHEIVDAYRNKLPQIKIIDATERKGASYARNTGVLHARGKYIVFLDADDVVAINWVKHIGEALIRHDFVASRMDFSKLNSPELLKTQGSNQDQGLMEFSVVRFLPFASTCGLGIRKDIHEKIGGFDEEMKYVEDAEYCWRVHIAGYKLYFAEKAIIHYRLRDTLWRSFKQARNYGEYDVLLYKKYQKFNIPKQNKKKAINDWKKLFRRIPKLYDSENRTIMVKSFGKKIGRLKGSIKYGIFVP